MRRIHAMVMVLVLAMYCCGPALAETEEEAVAQVLRAYEAAWNRHDAQAVAGFYYEPAMRVGRGGPMVRPTRADQEAFFSSFLRGLVSRGYTRSAWEQLEVRLLDTETAIASGVTGRYTADGGVLERVAVTYGLRKTAEGWKIFLSTTHAPDTVLRFR